MNKTMLAGFLLFHLTILQIHGADLDDAKKDAAEINLEKGNEFLEQNKKNPGIVVRPSGLQYQVLKKGKGPSPRMVDEVEVHYQGTLISGKVFDSSIERGHTVTFPVSHVIRGWTEALLLMNEGSKWKLFIPAHLAYGEKGTGSSIGPNETLIFEVELIKILQ